MPRTRFFEGEGQADRPAASSCLGGAPASSREPLRSVPDDYRCGKALGPVESLQGHLRDPTKILIGYSRGLLVIWNRVAQCADRVFLGNQVCGGGQHQPPRSSAPAPAHAHHLCPAAAGEPVLGAQRQHAGQLP